MLGTDQPFLTESIDLIKQKYETDLAAIFKDQRYLSTLVFFEFFGKSSFAGHHIEEPHDILLIDVSVFKKGILPPGEYMDLFGHLSIASLLYTGNANHPFADSVKNSTLEGMTEEGVVCKAKNPRANFPSTIMFKIKTDKWLQKLKDYCKGDQELFDRLM